MKRKILSVLLALTLTAALCGCGAKDDAPAASNANTAAEKESTEGTTTETAQKAEAGERTSKDMYMDFLAGSEKVYAEKIDKTFYNYNTDQFEPYFDAKESFTVIDLMKKVIEVEQMDYDLTLTGFQYSLIDCGLDGEPELALYATFDTGYSESVEMQFVLKNINGKLQLCYMMEGYYRSYTCLANISGLVTSYGSAGAGSSYYGTGIIDANGDYKFAYDDEESYWPIYSLDERFEGLISEEEMEGQDLYLSIYDFVEYNDDNWDEILAKRIYCAEIDPEIYFEGDEEANLATLEPIFEKANVKLYSLEELNQAIAAREKEVGITDAMKNADYMDWISYEVDFNEINGIKEISVSSVDELLNAIDSRTCIVLAPGEYNVTDWLNTQIRKGKVSSYYTYDAETDDFVPAEYYGEAQIFYNGTDYEPGLVLRGLNYCTLKSADASNPATIVSDPRGEDVIDFYECNGMAFENIVFGHTDGNDECAGDVLYFRDCDSVKMDHCDLYGCGATGIDLVECYNFDVDNMVIHDCSVGGIYVSGSYGMRFSNSTLQDIEGYGMISMSDGGLTFVQCTFRGEYSPMLSGWLSGYIEFYDCTFDPELKEEILNNELYGESIYIYD